MKIVDLCEFYSSRGGGVRSYLTRMAASARSLGHEVVIVAPAAREEEQQIEGGRVLHYPGPRMPYDPTYHAPLRIDRMRALVEREQPDVIQVSSPFLPAWVAGSVRSAAPRVYVHHSDPIGCYLRPWVERHCAPALREALLAPAWAWLRRVTGAMDASITAGDWLTDQLRAHGCERVTTVPFGIAHDGFGPDRRDPALRARLLGRFHATPDAKLLLITGRLAVDKRQHLLIEAARELGKEQPIALVVLGDGPERERLIAQSRELPQVTFLPFLHDRGGYASLLASSDLLLHGSRCETFGFVIAETLASGTPVVVPDAGAAPHMVDAQCARVYAADAGSESIADAAREVLSWQRPRVVASALATARRHPTMDGHFAALFALYERLLSDRAGRSGAPGRAPIHPDVRAAA